MLVCVCVCMLFSCWVKKRARVRMANVQNVLGALIKYGSESNEHCNIIWCIMSAMKPTAVHWIDSCVTLVVLVLLLLAQRSRVFIEFNKWAVTRVSVCCLLFLLLCLLFGRLFRNTHIICTIRGVCTTIQTQWYHLHTQILLFRSSYSSSSLILFFFWSCCCFGFYYNFALVSYYFVWCKVLHRRTVNVAVFLFLLFFQAYSHIKSHFCVWYFVVYLCCSLLHSL